MRSSETTAVSIRRTLTATLCGLAIGSLAYAASIMSVMVFAPRRDENIRQVVALSWPVYSSLPGLIASSVLILLLFVPLPSAMSRLPFIIAAGIGIVVSAIISFDLLRRDFVGKL